MADLKRELSLVDAVGVGLGAIIGAGLFVATGLAARLAGPAFLVGLLIAGVAAACNALSSAQLAASFPQAGGTYEYGYRVLNPWLGFSAGWMFLVSKLAAAGIVALGFASYVSRYGLGGYEAWVASGAIILLVGLNLLGIKKAGRVNTVVVAVTLGILLLFVVVGFSRFDFVHLTPFAPRGAGGMMQSAAVLFFAYTGYARLATLGEEVVDPRRTIPRAIVIAMVLASLLYVAVSAAAVGLIGAPAMADSARPLEEAAAATSVPWLPQAIVVAAATAMLGVLLSQILGISRMMFAMARRGDLPAGLGRVRAQSGVPVAGVVVTGAIVLAVAWVGRLEFILSTAAFTILLYYSIANVAALRMNRADKLFPDWIAGLGLVSCLALASSLSWQVAASGAGLLGVGLLYRVVWRWGSAR
jgi:APA family basic amino acid/polyamine antiporter